MMRALRTVGRWLTERVDTGMDVADRLLVSRAQVDAGNDSMRRTVRALDRVTPPRVDRKAGAR